MVWPNDTCQCIFVQEKVDRGFGLDNLKVFLFWLEKKGPKHIGGPNIGNRFLTVYWKMPKRLFLVASILLLSGKATLHIIGSLLYSKSWSTVMSTTTALLSFTNCRLHYALRNFLSTCLSVLSDHSILQQVDPFFSLRKFSPMIPLFHVLFIRELRCFIQWCKKWLIHIYHKACNFHNFPTENSFQFCILKYHRIS